MNSTIKPVTLHNPFKRKQQRRASTGTYNHDDAFQLEQNYHHANQNNNNTNNTNNNNTSSFPKQLELLQGQVEDGEQQHATNQSAWQRDLSTLQAQADQSNKASQRAQQRMEWLEEELQIVIVASNQQQQDDDDDNDDDDDSQEVPPSNNNNNNNVIVWQAQRDYLEQRMQELVLKNQRLTSQVDDDDDNVDLEEQVNELEQQQQQEQQYRELLGKCQDRAQQYEEQVHVLQTQVGRQEETRDSYRTEWARRIEALELENVELRRYQLIQGFMHQTVLSQTLEP
jgi:hypothetical protein